MFSLAAMETYLDENRTVLKEFVMANAFIHLERTLLCRDLKISTDFHKEFDSRSIAELLFLKLGHCPLELSELPKRVQLVRGRPDGQEPSPVFLLDSARQVFELDKVDEENLEQDEA